MLLSRYSNSTIYGIIASIVHSNQKRLKIVELPYNNTALNIVDLLLRNNRISGYRIHRQYGRCFILVSLRYPDNKPMLFNLKFISKPSRRVYLSVRHLRSMLLRSRSSMIVVSSSYGIVSGADALLLNIGGEVICVLN